MFSNSSMSSLSSWVNHFPLQTVQRVLHIMFPQTKDWSFTSNITGSNDQEIFKEFYFTDTRELASLETGPNSVVVVCQPPWILSHEDMWQFTELKSVSTSICYLDFI